MAKTLTKKRIETLEEQVRILKNTLASWRKAGIPEHTLVILLSHKTKVPQRTVRLILEGMDSLYEEYFMEKE